MTGVQLERTRVIVSPRLISPIACCGNFNSKAIEFRAAQFASARTGRLMPDIAVKALDPLAGEKKPTYEDTDNKKRDFTGDSIPGVEKNDLGYRWETSRTWEPGRKLSLFPSYLSKEGMKTKPNFGWIDEGENQPKSFDELITKVMSKPGIQLTKYRVNPKTDDVIPESAKVIDSFAMFSGMTQDERLRKQRKAKDSGIQEKVLPGRPLSSLIPGGTLIARAAAAVGVLIDERNKFRCPPGTPAANQFTDAMGSNCFGFSPSRFARFAARQARKMTEADDSGNWRRFGQTARNFFNFWYNDTWSDEARGIATPEQMQRVAFWESVSGDRFKPPSWRNIPVEEDLRLFRNGMIRAQDDIARQKANVRELYSALGIDPDDVDAPVKALEQLRQIHTMSGGRAGWDIEIINVSGGSSGNPQGRLLPDEVRRFAEARLMSTPGWVALTKAEQTQMIDSDVRRYYETERALIETLLDKFIENPEETKFIGRVAYNFMSDDEANLRVYDRIAPPAPLLDEDGMPKLDRDGNPIFAQQKELRGQIEINLGMILSNQETMLPDMGGTERLAIAAVGARSDAEAHTAVADFMVNAEHTARGMAGLVDGVYSFSSHIMLHEISHGVQAQVFLDLIDDELRYKGYIDIPIVDPGRGVVVGNRRVTSLKQLTSKDVMTIMTQVADGIDIAALGETMERIKDVSNLAGQYPREMVEGSELWALEASAEIWALRERGIIYGDDVDRALEWMDRLGRRRAAETRTEIDDDSSMDADDGEFGPRPDDSPVPDMPEDEMDAALDDAEERTISSARDELSAFRDALPEMSEDEILSESAIVALQRDEAERILALLERETIDRSLPPEEVARLEAARDRAIREARLGRELYSAKYDEAKKAWRKKYGLGTRGDSARFDEEVRAIRERDGLFSEEEIARIAREARLDDIRDSASRMTDKALVRRIADEEIRLKAIVDSPEEAAKLAEEIEVLKSQYVKNIKESGDSRTSAKIRRDLDAEVKAIVSPPPKKIKKFKDAADAKAHAAKERKRLRASKVQKDALASLGDISSADVGLLFDPKVQTRVGRAMNERNRRLKRLGLEIDEKSPEQGDMVQQIENLLIPAMEAIDGSSIADPFEMETIIDFPDGSLRGAIEGREVEVGKFISGRVATRRMKKTDIPDKGIRDKEAKTTARRVIIQVREGDRGIFPRAGEGEQRFVAPPGKIRIISRDSDGTIRAEISYQKDAVEVIDSLADSIENNKGDKIWREGAGPKIKLASDKYVIRRREEGIESPGPRSDYSSTGVEVSDALIDDVIDAGGYFGEYPEDDADISLSSGLSIPRDRTQTSGGGHFGGRKTRKQSTKERQTKLSSGIRSVKQVLAGEDDGNGIYRADLDDDVVKVLINTPEEELIRVIEDAAYKLHGGFDRRVRVRARDEDIDELLRTGAMRSPMASGVSEPSISRRAQRRARDAGSSRRKLSSGIVSTREELDARRRKEDEINTSAVNVFKKLAEGGVSLDTMDSASVEAALEGKGRRSRQRSVSAKHPYVYETEDMPTAIALMMLGHHVSVKGQDLKLTALSQDKFEKLIKQEAKSHIDNPDSAGHGRWLAFRDRIAKEEGLDIENKANLDEIKRAYIEQHQSDLCGLYDPSKNLMCSGNIGIEREKMPQTNGRTLGADTAAARAMKAGRVAGKWETKKSSLSEPPQSVLDKYSDELKKAVDAKNKKLTSKGGEPLDRDGELKELHQIIAGKYTVRNEWGETQAQHRDSDEFKSITKDDLDWMFENTDWQDTEANLESPFIDMLNRVIKTDDGRPGVILRQVEAGEYAPSQRQLVSSKVASTAQDMLSDAVEIGEQIRSEFPDITPEEFRAKFIEQIGKKWYSSPILATQDKFILDGHHRWGSINLANQSLPQEMQIPLNVNEVQTDIVEGLTLGKVMQNKWGIKEAKLGVERKWTPAEGGVAGIKDISDEEISAISEEMVTNIGTLVDEIYEGGHFIELGSVGLSNNPDYAKRLVDRREEARLRKPIKEERIRQREIDATAREGLVSRRSESAREMVGAGALSSGRRRSRTSGTTKPDSGREQTQPQSELEKLADEIHKKAKARQEMGEGYMESLEGLVFDARVDAANSGNSLDADELIKLINEKLPKSGSSRALSSGKASITESRVGGLAHEELANEYYSSIGLPGSIDRTKLPVSGYLVHRSHRDSRIKNAIAARSGNLNGGGAFEIGDEDVVGDGLTAHGDIEIVLRPSVSRRTAYGRGNALSSGHKPVLMNSRNRQDIADAIVNMRGTNGDKQTNEAMISLLSASIDGDFSRVNASRQDGGRFLKTGIPGKAGDAPREPFEAQILGGFDVDEIEQINYPFSRVQQIAASESIDDVVNDRTIAEKLRAAGYSQEEIEYFYSIGGSGSFNTESMAMLRNYRAAQRIKKSYAERGLPNVKIAHPDGINIDDARSYAKGAVSGLPVEQVLKDSISNEILEEAQKLLKEMKKPKAPKMVGRRGGFL